MVGAALLFFCVVIWSGLALSNDAFYTLNGAVDDETADKIFATLSDPRISTFSKLTKVEELNALQKLFGYVLESQAGNGTRDEIESLKNRSYEEWRHYSSGQFQSQEAEAQFQDLVRPVTEQYLSLNRTIHEKDLQTSFGLLAYVDEKSGLKGIKLNDPLNNQEQSAMDTLLYTKSRVKPYIASAFARDFPAIWEKLLEVALKKLKSQKDISENVEKILKELWADGNGDGNYFALYSHLAGVSGLNPGERKQLKSMIPVTARNLDLLVNLVSAIDVKVKESEEGSNQQLVDGFAKVVQLALTQTFEKLNKSTSDDLLKLLKSEKTNLFQKFYNISQALPNENVLQGGAKDLEKSGLDRKALRAFENLAEMYIKTAGKASYFVNRGLSQEDGNLAIDEILARLTPVQYEQLKALVPGARKGLQDFLKST